MASSLRRRTKKTEWLAGFEKSSAPEEAEELHFRREAEGTGPLESRYQVEFLFSLEQRGPVTRRKGGEGEVKVALAEVDRKMDSALGKCKTTGEVHKCKKKKEERAK